MDNPIPLAELESLWAEAAEAPEAAEAAEAAEDVSRARRASNRREFERVLSRARRGYLTAAEYERYNVPPETIAIAQLRRWRNNDLSWFDDPNDILDRTALAIMSVITFGLMWWFFDMINGFVASGFGFG